MRSQFKHKKKHMGNVKFWVYDGNFEICIKILLLYLIKLIDHHIHQNILKGVVKEKQRLTLKDECK